MACEPASTTSRFSVYRPVSPSRSAGPPVEHCSGWSRPRASPGGTVPFQNTLLFVLQKSGEDGVSSSHPPVNTTHPLTHTPSPRRRRRHALRHPSAAHLLQTRASTLLWAFFLLAAAPPRLLIRYRSVQITSFPILRTCFAVSILVSTPPMIQVACPAINLIPCTAARSV